MTDTPLLSQCRRALYIVCLVLTTLTSGLISSSAPRAAAQGAPIDPPFPEQGHPGRGAFALNGLPPTVGLDAVAVAAGFEHSCLLTSEGVVKCWGRNNFGQLGIGTQEPSSTPVQVVGLASGVKMIALGAYHSCAVMRDGTVSCWGSNSDGQLGAGAIGAYFTPIAVAGLTKVFFIAAGEEHTCSLDLSGGQSYGEAKCWGDNTWGQLGDGTKIERPIPTPVTELPKFGRRLSAGTRHTCLTDAVGTVHCWGNNEFRQLGNGAVVESLKPIEVPGVVGVSLSGGRLHTCAETYAESLVCWGRNFFGQLGNGANEDSSTPVMPTGFVTVSAFAAGGSQTCAAQTGGPLRCWGSNDQGQLGTGMLSISTVPTNVLWLSEGVSQVAVGRRHACAVMKDRSVKCWGDNAFGQLGDGTGTDSRAPVQVKGYATGFVAVSAGGSHTCGLLYDGGAACWGLNVQGQLGTGSFLSGSVPLRVVGLPEGVLGVSSGGAHTCSIFMKDGRSGAHCWGSNGYGQLGVSIGNLSPMPRALANDSMRTLSAGANHTCGVSAQGVQCWGRNDSGQLGDGTQLSAVTPVLVRDLISTTKLVAAGGGHTCAVKGDDTLVCWGQNDVGQLGNGSGSIATSPMTVPNLPSPPLAVTAGDRHTCALSSAGAAYCWGWNLYGQLGSGSPSLGASAPVPVTGVVSGGSRVDAGAIHTCAVVDGALHCWGGNWDGQLGDGTTTPSRVPVAVAGMHAGVVDVTAGDRHTCALTSAGTVHCWGSNELGQLGTGDAANSLRPVEVADAIIAQNVLAPAVYR